MGVGFDITEHIWSFVFGILFLIILYLIKNKLSIFSKFFVAEDALVNDLRNKVSELERKVNALQITIQVLVDKLAVATAAMNGQPPTQVPEQPASNLAVIGRPVLLVYGNNKFGEADRNAMRRAGVSFFRLSSSTLEDLRTELQRRRSDGHIYDVVHISAHGGEGNLVLDEGAVSGMQLSDVLNGVRCVFLGTCSNQTVADKLVGVVKYVVVVYEEIKDTDAADFTYEFYKRYKENGMNIDMAFMGALAVMPHISDYVDLRKGG